MKAARIVKLNEPLQVQELQTPTPKGTQVLIKIQSSGVCHSDVHVWEGYYEGIGGQQLKTTDRGVKYPLTPGHEIAGIVDSLGEQAEGFSKNEKVLVYPWIGEGMCPACRIGEENLCDKPRSLGIYTDGGYAQYVLVPSYRYLVKIGDDMDTDTSAPLSCGTYSIWCSKKCYVMHVAIHNMISPDLACTLQGITDLFYPTHLDLHLFGSANIPACYLFYIDLIL